MITSHEDIILYIMNTFTLSKFEGVFGSAFESAFAFSKSQKPTKRTGFPKLLFL